MNIDILKKDIEAWVNDWVSQFNTKLNQIPCPFAKQAMLADKIEYAWCESADHLRITLYALMEEGLPKEVVVIGLDPGTITARSLADVVDLANQKWLMPSGLVALEDHPDDPEIIAGERMNQGTWALVLIQASEKLETASRMLAKQGYYDSWSQENIDDVVSWRKR